VSIRNVNSNVGQRKVRKFFTETKTFILDWQDKLNFSLVAFKKGGSSKSKQAKVLKKTEKLVLSKDYFKRKLLINHLLPKNNVLV